MDKFAVTMRLDHETKGAVKYCEVKPDGSTYRYPNEPGSKIGVQYIRKTAFNGGLLPSSIKVTVEDAGE